MNDLITVQRIEGALVFVAAMVMFANLDSSLSLWLVLIVFFLPDSSFAAYLLGF